LIIPIELQSVLDDDPSTRDAFNGLSKSKKREYAEHISSAKQEKTKVNRLNKIIPLIQSGQGLNDKYKK